MANRKTLKKMINNEMGDVITSVYAHWEALPKDADRSASEAIIDQAIADFDGLMAQVNVRKLDQPKVHFKQVQATFGDKVAVLHKQLAAL